MEMKRQREIKGSVIPWGIHRRVYARCNPALDLSHVYVWMAQGRVRSKHQILHRGRRLGIDSVVNSRQMPILSPSL